MKTILGLIVGCLLAVVILEAVHLREDWNRAKAFGNRGTGLALEPR